jgi:type VI secretion system secreted protein VgrG
MADLSQSERIAELTTPLGKDVLVLVQFNGTEGLGELFEFHIEAISEQENIDFDKALGQGCTLKLKAYKDKERIYNGILTHAQWVGKGKDYYRYKLVLRPWLFLLGHRADCRIFLDKDVRDIIKDVFSKAGFTEFDDRTSSNYDKIPYCVQYRETDLTFVTRLMEQYGIYYFFEHSDGKHTLVMADSHSSHKAVADLPKVPFIPFKKKELHTEPHLSEWTSERRFRTGKVQYNDYDYLKPGKNLLAPAEASENYTNSKLEVYDYHPARYDEQDKGKDFARFRLEAEQAADRRRHIRGDAASLFPGGLVTVEKHLTDSENKEYLIVRCGHRFLSHHYRSVSASDQETTSPAGALAEPASATGTEQDQVYYGSYEFQQSDRPFRLLPVTPKPRIRGIHTAKVVPKQGEDSEEISTDEYGRIWVQFFWDREPQKSCPIRVSHVHASKQWGGQFIPRVGMEVVVQFLEGDPDRPLVTGVVYNGDNKHPYILPDNKTMSGWKTDSSKGGNGYNEFVFEDKKMSEKIRMHGEKDHEVVIKNSENWTIGEIFPSPQGSPSRETTLKNGDDKLTLEMGHQNVTLNMGNQNINLQMGNQQIDLDMGAHTTNAMQGITLNVMYGLSSIAITPSSVAITSPTISLTAEADISMEAMAVNITAPVVNITGVVNILGALTVDGQVPMLI